MRKISKLEKKYAGRRKQKEAMEAAGAVFLLTPAQHTKLQKLKRKSERLDGKLKPIELAKLQELQEKRDLEMASGKHLPVL